MSSPITQHTEISDTFQINGYSRWHGMLLSQIVDVPFLWRWRSWQRNWYNRWRHFERHANNGSAAESYSAANVQVMLGLTFSEEYLLQSRLPELLAGQRPA